ncbi:MAG: esterase/lipase family protein [Lacipirellulaceae bacterium]
MQRPSSSTLRARHAPKAGTLLAIVVAASLAGCATTDRWIERRPPAEAVAASYLWASSPAPTFSTTVTKVAAAAGINPNVDAERERLLELLEAEVEARPTPELDFAISELSAHEADRLAESDPERSLALYADSLVHGYRVLAADPRKRVPGTTARYNRSLESLLRVLHKRGQVQPGGGVPLALTHSACGIVVELHSQRWTAGDFHDLEFAEDFQVLGLRNHYATSGVGVPLIAVREHPDTDHPVDRFYCKKLCYPLTAFVRADATPVGAPAEGEACGAKLVLELHDPTDHSALAVGTKALPLASDLTTPLAYYLDQPELHDEKDISTMGLLNPGSVKQQQGLYLLEPYDPNRIPVVMVHGLWSSPATWMEMFNELRADPQLRARYQFWFYLYPTGHPFWVSAAQMRVDMAQLRNVFDPNHTAPALDQTVLVGHSMGGLLSRLQTVDSGDDFWRIVSDRQFAELDADPEVRQYLSDLFYFQPNPSVRRVVTIGTPHRGSRFANGFTQWVSAKLIAFPMQTMAKRQELFRRNPGFFKPNIAARVITSIDSLAPNSPVLTTLLAARPGPWVSYHNIVGDVPRSGASAWYSNRGDGVVSIQSARLDDLPQLESQVVVPEDHVTLHRHPQSIEEVRRVLRSQLEEITRPEVAAATTAPVRRRSAVEVASFELATP